MNETKAPVLLTIRQTAARGVLTEYSLRLLEKQNRLPCIKIGNRTMVNFDALCAQLNNVGGKEK